MHHQQKLFISKTVIYVCFTHSVNMCLVFLPPAAKTFWTWNWAYAFLVFIYCCLLLVRYHGRDHQDTVPQTSTFRPEEPTPSYTSFGRIPKKSSQQEEGLFYYCFTHTSDSLFIVYLHHKHCLSHLFNLKRYLPTRSTRSLIFELKCVATRNVLIKLANLIT